jgi:tRNA dimethylallyltransferase
MGCLIVSTAPQVIVITGSTATGKTRVGVELAKRLNTDVISCDSQLVYTGMNIGTAKPTAAERQGIVHHAMNIVPPNAIFSAADYAQHVLPLMVERIQREQPVILVGGTGFYLRALLEPMPITNVPANPTLRRELDAWASQQTSEYPLHDRLTQVDPLRASQLYPQDTARVLRALEIVETLGKPVPQEKAPSLLETALGYPPCIQWVGLFHEQQQHHWDLIHQRVVEMVEEGWLDEVKQLVDTYGEDAHALHVAHGYHELINVLNGEQSLDEAIDVISIQVRQYARRQRKWFRSHTTMQWMDVSSIVDVEQQLALIGLS